MNVQFTFGRIDLRNPNVDALICPTDSRLSGSGGLDLAIRQAAGPGLQAALAGKQLQEGELLVTEGFDLDVRYILHVAVPVCTEDAIREDSLYRCYCRILEDLTFPYFKTPRHTASLPLIGTGHSGWSYARSMDALWRAILNCRDSGPLETLTIHYPMEQQMLIIQYEYRTSQVFFSTPKQWGLRGDPYLWQDLKLHFDDPKFEHIGLREFIHEIQRFFREKSGTWLCGDTAVFVKNWAHGGMSSGMVSNFMARIGIPLLCDRLCRMNDWLEDPTQFLLPVTLRNRDFEETLLLPYDLLDDLTALQRSAGELTQCKRVCLYQPYHLETYHYRNAPEVVGYHVLECPAGEGIQGHRLAFSAKDGQTLCHSFGCGTLADGLRLYLQKHGGAALEHLLRPYENPDLLC